MIEENADLAQKLAALKSRFAAGLGARLAEIETVAGALRGDASAGEAKTALKSLADLAHQLAGTAGTFGFVALGEAALELESLCFTVEAEPCGLSAERRADIDGLLAVLAKEAGAGG